MNIMKKLLALCLALALLCGVALAEAAETENEQTTVPADTVLLTVGGREYTALDVDDIAYNLYSQGYTETYPDYEEAIDTLIHQGVLDYYLENNGYLDLSEEEEAAVVAEAQTTWNSAIESYVSYYATQDSEADQEQLRTQAEAYYAAQGYSLESLTDNARAGVAIDRLRHDLLNGYTPSEDEISETFQQLGALYQAEFENNVGAYEQYTQWQGYESLYVPEGYRGITHILLTVDDELLSAFKDAQAALDEAQSEEPVDEAAVAAAQTALEEAKAAVIASRQDVIDEIYARLEKGEAFQDLIAEYGTDPGMKQAENLENGYAVHADSIMYDSAFTAGAFQERMQKPGDVSDPVVGSYGIHILYYLKDIPGGLVLTDSIRASIVEYLMSDKLNSAYNEAYTQWEQEVDVVRNEEMIQRFMEEAAAEQAE